MLEFVLCAVVFQFAALKDFSIPSKLMCSFVCFENGINLKFEHRIDSLKTVFSINLCHVKMHAKSK